MLHRYERIPDLSAFAGVCSDRDDCDNRPCVVVQATDPQSNLYMPLMFQCREQMTLHGRCYRGDAPLLGCNWYLEQGTCRMRCVDVVEERP